MKMETGLLIFVEATWGKKIRSRGHAAYYTVGFLPAKRQLRQVQLEQFYEGIENGRFAHTRGKIPKPSRI